MWVASSDVINFDEFESLEKENPFFLLDQHPDGKHVAMHVTQAGNWHAFLA
jgi:hypothetical protein